MRARPLAAALLLFATAALAARTDEGQVFEIPQPPFSAITVIGVAGSGTVTIDDGTEEELPGVAMGGLAGADGTLRVQDAGSKLTTVGDPATRANTVAVGVAGAGTLEILDGGAVELDGSNNLAGDPLGASFAVGVSAGSTGGVLIDGGTLTVTNGGATPGGVAVGVGGAGIVHLEGAQVAIDTGTGENSGLSVGTSPGSTGFLQASSASTISLAGSGRIFSVGTGGTGEVVLDQEAVVTGAQIGFIGLEATGDGAVRIGGQAQLAISGFNPLLGFGGALQVGAAGRGCSRCSTAASSCSTSRPTPSTGSRSAARSAAAGPAPSPAAPARSPSWAAISRSSAASAARSWARTATARCASPTAAAS